MNMKIKKISKNVNIKEVKNSKEIAGKGIEYTLEGKHIKIGNRSFTESKEKEDIADFSDCNSCGIGSCNVFLKF